MWTCPINWASTDCSSISRWRCGHNPTRLESWRQRSKLVRSLERLNLSFLPNCASVFCQFRFQSPGHFVCLLLQVRIGVLSGVHRCFFRNGRKREEGVWQAVRANCLASRMGCLCFGGGPDWAGRKCIVSISFFACFHDGSHQLPFDAAMKHKCCVADVFVFAGSEGRSPILGVIYDEVVRSVVRSFAWLGCYMW